MSDGETTSKKSESIIISRNTSSIPRLGFEKDEKCFSKLLHESAENKSDVRSTKRYPSEEDSSDFGEDALPIRTEMQLLAQRHYK